MSKTPSWILSKISLAVLMKASSTLAAVLAEVSMKTSPCSRAKASPSSRFTSRRASRSLQEHACQISLVIVQKFSRPFVANEHDHHVAVAVLPGIFQPSGLRRCKKNIDHEISICLKMRTRGPYQVIECVPARNIIHKESARSSSII